jgi:DNA-binding beta-propeller fold protein YncE
MFNKLSAAIGCILLLTMSTVCANDKNVLVRGAPMAGAANGIFFDQDDNLWVASVFGQAIRKIDPESGEILDLLGPDELVFFPDDLTFDAWGNLYWTDAGGGYVFGRIPGGPSFPVAVEFPSANAITISDDGRLFFAQCFGAGVAGNGIFEADPYGILPPIPIRTGDPGCASNGMDWWDGDLYSPRWYEGRVAKVDINTGILTDVTTGWGVPTALKFNSLGELHAVNQGNGEVVKIDRNSGNREVLAVLPIGWSDNLAFDSSDRLFVSSVTDGTIAEILPGGDIRIVSPGGMTVPMGIALIGDTVYVGEPQSVRGFDTHSGEAVSVSRSIFGIGPALFTTAVSAVGENLILLSLTTGQVMLWNPSTGSPVNQSFFAAPVDAEPFGDQLLITDAGIGGVVRVSLSDLDDRETIASGFYFPAGLAVHGGDAYFSDTILGAVFQIVRDGAVLAEPVMVADGLAGPEGIALRAGGNKLLVVEGLTSTLKEINLRSGRVKTIAKELGFQPSLGLELPAQWFNDVDVDSTNAMYVNADGANVIYKFNSHRNVE